MMNTVVCLKWGNKYGPEYVNILYAMVKRNLTIPFDFVCVTDDATGLNSGIDTLAIDDLAGSDDVSGMVGWWYKLMFFKKTIGSIKGKILFLDLDVVIIDNIDDLFSQPHNLSIVQEWYSKGYNSSVFALEIGSHVEVWDEFMKDSNKNMKSMHGDQNWLDRMNLNANTWDPEWCVSFKYHCAKKPLPNGAKIVLFHGTPNPPEAIIGKYPRYGTADWIEKYWKI